MILFNILHIFLTILIITVEIFRKKTMKIDALTFVNAWFFIVFNIVPLLIINFGSKFAHPTFYYITEKGFIYPSLLIIIFYLTFVLTYYLVPKNKLIIVTRDSPFNRKFLLLFLGFFALIGMVGFIYSYGGISNLISNISTIRNGSTSRNTIGAFLGLFGNYVVVIFWYFLSLKISEKKLPFNYNLIFFISLAITLSWVLVRGSRGGVIDVFLVSYSLLVITKKKLYKRYLVLFVVFVTFILLYGKVVFATFSPDLSETLEIIKRNIDDSDIVTSLQNVVHNFAHPYMSLNLSMDKANDFSEYRYFMDIPYAIIFYLQLFGIEAPTTITYLNSFYVLGRLESNIPPGIIAFGYYSLGSIGVFINAIFFGFICKKIDLLFKTAKIDSQDKFTLIIYLIIISALGQFIIVGDIRVTIIQKFPYIIFVILYLILMVRIKKLK